MAKLWLVHRADSHGNIRRPEATDLTVLFRPSILGEAGLEKSLVMPKKRILLLNGPTFRDFDLDGDAAISCFCANADKRRPVCRGS